jgi:hypothetical protein
MAKRKHSKMIKAWADNDELVVLARRDDPEWWLAYNPEWHDDCEYFMCLPKHKEECLRWLNYGDIQCKDEMGVFIDTCFGESEWTTSSVWMDNDNIFRIRPKKAIRYVVIHKGKLVGELFKSDADIRASYGAEYHELQIFPIEVEA